MGWGLTPVLYRTELAPEYVDDESRTILWDAKCKGQVAAFDSLVTIKGFEVMRALRKGQAGIFAIQGGIIDEARIVERAFNLGLCALTEAMASLQDRLANAES